MLEFLTLKPKAFGLDISDLSLKIVQLSKNRRFLELSSFGEIQITPGIIKRGEIRDKKKLIGFIKKALIKVSGKKIETKYVVASLPEQKAFLQVIKMPIIAKEDLHSAVIYESENYIPMPIEDVYLDSQLIPPVKDNLDHYNVSIVALPKKTIDPYVSCLEDAGLKPLALELESIALGRALIKNESVTTPILLIDLGATKTSFAVFSGSSLRFTSSTPNSSRKFNDIISQSLQIDKNEAEKLKLEYGLENKNSKGKEIFEILQPSLIDLIEQIKKHLDYYKTHVSDNKLTNILQVKKIVLCGGGANLKGLTTFLLDKLGVLVELGDPLINISNIKNMNTVMPTEKLLSYSTAIGLALRGIKND